MSASGRQPPVATPYPIAHRQPSRSPQNAHTHAQSSTNSPHGGHVGTQPPYASAIRRTRSLIRAERARGPIAFSILMN
jgi:hypothetical protein